MRRLPSHRMRRRCPIRPRCARRVYVEVIERPRAELDYRVPLAPGREFTPTARWACEASPPEAAGGLSAGAATSSLRPARSRRIRLLRTSQASLPIEPTPSRRARAANCAPQYELGCHAAPAPACGSRAVPARRRILRRLDRRTVRWLRWLAYKRATGRPRHLLTREKTANWLTKLFPLEFTRHCVRSSNQLACRIPATAASTSPRRPVRRAGDLLIKPFVTQRDLRRRLRVA